MSEPSAQAPAPGRAAFLFIFITVALDMLALGVMIPVWPKLVMLMEGGDLTAAARMTGYSGLLWAAMQFFFQPVMGALSDKLGRRPIVLLSNLGMGLDYVLMALAPNLAWLFLGRALSGITSASFSTASAYIADVTPADQRAAKFGMLGAAFGLGFVIGPAVGGVLGHIDLRLPFWVSAGLSLANFAYGFFILPESLPVERRRTFRWQTAHPFGAIKRLGKDPVLRVLGAVAFFSALSHESLPNTFVLSSTARYGWTERDTGWALMVVGIVSTVISGGVVRPLVRRLGERKALYVGLVTGCVGFTIYGLAPYPWVFLMGIPVAGMWSVASPAMQASMSRRMDPSEQGALQGAVSSLRGMSGMLGPLVFTEVMARGIEITGSPQGAGASFLLSACLLILCALLVGVAWRRADEPAA